MAYVAKFVRGQQASAMEYERQAIAIEKVKEWVEVPFEWQDKQTAKAVHFSTYGWVPKVAIAGKAKDGTMLPWNVFHQDHHKFCLAKWFMEKSK